MQVGRFSPTGFIPQYQFHMRRYVDYLQQFDENICGFEGYVLETMKLGVSSQLKTLDPNFCFTGIHVFFLPLKESDKILFLNHLDIVPHYNEVYLDDNVPAYGLDAPYCSPISTLGELFSLKHIGAYIPFSSAYPKE